LVFTASLLDVSPLVYLGKAHNGMPLPLSG